MNFAFITAPLVGSFIGYITNFIAIKMLFKPIEAKYIFGIKIPFTPGIIPREKERLAKSIGIVVGEKLLTNDIIMDTLHSPQFRQSIEKFIDQKLEEIQTNEQKINDILHYMLDMPSSSLPAVHNAESGDEYLAINVPNHYEDVLTYIRNNAADFLYQKLNSPEVTAKITSHISQSIENYIENQLSNPLIKMALGLNKGLLDALMDSINNKIKELLRTNSRAIIDTLVEDELQSLLNLEIRNLSEKLSNKIPEIREVVLNSFNRLIKDNIKTITSALDIPTMVEKRINELDILEVEQLILSVVDKELKAIIWLGAFLGMVMGFLMPLFS